MALDERQLPPNWVPPAPQPGAPPPEPEEVEHQEDLHAAVIERRLKLRAQEEKEAHREERAEEFGKLLEADRASRRRRLGKVALMSGLWSGLLALLMAGPVPPFFYLMVLAGAASGAWTAHKRASHLQGMLVFGAVPIGAMMLSLASGLIGLPTGGFASLPDLTRFFSAWVFYVLTGAVVALWARDKEDAEKDPF